MTFRLCLWFVLASFCWVQKPVCLWSQARRRHAPFFFGVPAVHGWTFVASVNWSNANSLQGIWMRESSIQMPWKELALLSLHAEDVFCIRVGQCFEDVVSFFVFKALSTTDVTCVNRGFFLPPLWTMPWGHCPNVLRFLLSSGHCPPLRWAVWPISQT